jgi:DNA (cytosine-5)-methyltransferase 1
VFYRYTSLVQRRPTAIDLFAGAGGMSLGFESAGFDVRAAVEYDPIHAATYKFNFPNSTVICRSVSDISGTRIRSEAFLPDDIDVVFGGPPCQGFSLIGKRSLEDPRNQLVYDFVRLVAEIRPKVFVFENVKGLTVGPHKKFLHELIGEFKRRGFNVREDYAVLNAAEFGVPQERHRLFLIGTRRGVPLPEYPKATHFTNGAIFRPHTPTVWDALSDLPDADEFPELLDRDWVVTEFGAATSYSRLLRQLPDAKGRELLSSSLRTIHSALSTKRFAETKAGAVEPVSRFLKLNPEGLCNTIRAGTASDRGAFTSPRPIHPYKPRCITVREAARLHSYPDWFRFHVTKWHGFRQVGNSVPPLLAKAVASELAKALGLGSPKVLRMPVNRNGLLLQLGMSDAADWFGVPHDVVPARRRAGVDTAYA